MANLEKFLSQSGVSTLWGQVVAEISKQVNDNKYDDTAVKNLIATEKSRAEGKEAELAQAITNEATTARTAEKANADAIAVLKGGSSVEGSVAYQIAQIVTANGGAVDTLNEIAAWIAAHPDSVTALQNQITANKNASDKNATDIAANLAAINGLKELVGTTSVAAQISDAIAKSGHATASALAEAVARIKTVEDWKTSLAGTGVRLITQNEIDKLGKLALNGDDLSISGSVDAGSVLGLSDAVDARIAIKVVAMSEQEIKDACK